MRLKAGMCQSTQVAIGLPCKRLAFPPVSENVTHILKDSHQNIYTTNPVKSGRFQLNNL